MHSNIKLVCLIHRNIFLNTPILYVVSNHSVPSCPRHSYSQGSVVGPVDSRSRRVVPRVFADFCRDLVSLGTSPVAPLGLKRVPLESFCMFPA